MPRNEFLCKFNFDSAVPKYLILATFSVNLLALCMLWMGPTFHSYDMNIYSVFSLLICTQCLCSSLWHLSCYSANEHDQCRQDGDVSHSFQGLLVFFAFLMAHSKANLRSNGDTASPYSRLFYTANTPRKWFLVNDQRDAQFFTMFLFLFLTLYLFRAHHAHHQERQIMSTHPLVTVTLHRCTYLVQVGSELPTCTLYGCWHRVTITRGCIDTICLSWLWAQCARNR